MALKSVVQRAIAQPPLTLFNPPTPLIRLPPLPPMEIITVSDTVSENVSSNERRINRSNFLDLMEEGSLFTKKGGGRFSSNLSSLYTEFSILVFRVYVSLLKFDFFFFV